MRKLLMASAAIMGASVGMASHAFAQATNDTIGDSLVTLDTSGSSATSDTSGQSSPAPGTITVRLNGRFRWFVGTYSAGAARTSAFSGTAGTSNGVGNTNIGSNKLSNYGINEYARIYPGFDGVAANGLKYGASLEVRAEGTHPSGGSFGSVSAAEQGNSAMYWRRQWGYLGTDQLGTIRLGTTDGVSSLFTIGTMENFDGEGGWNGSGPPAFLPGVDVLSWAWNDSGNSYSTNKLVYLSPQFYGFDFGIGWEPTTGNSLSNGCGGSQFVGQIVAAGTSVAGPGCDNLSSTSATGTGDLSRRKNTVDFAVRYRGTFGPVGLASAVDYTHSSKINYTGTPIAGTSFQDLNYVDVGTTVTWNGITVGGNWKYGNYDGSADGTLKPTGARASNAWIAGASYAIGPLIVGASWLEYIHANGHVPSATVGMMREQGLAVGASYTIAPGLALLTDYLWGERRQSGVNLVNNLATNSAKDNNKVDASVFTVGMSFAW